jgi:hypothetical protein
MISSELGPHPNDSSENLDLLATHINDQLIGRVRDFRIVASGADLILLGQARSYYAKQLAQHAAMEATGLRILENRIEVDSGAGNFF